VLAEIVITATGPRADIRERRKISRVVTIRWMGIRGYIILAFIDESTLQTHDGRIGTRDIYSLASRNPIVRL
jgi:hypothetical protein